MKHNLFVLSGPSGVGKGTLAKLLIERNPELAISVSCTTRSPRPHEIDGKDYFFISKTDFENGIKNGEFYEYSNHFDNFYGTPKTYVEKTLLKQDVLLEIDVNGGEMIKKSNSNAILIFLTPPSIEELKQRLIKRNTETLEKIEKRLSRIDYEYAQESKYDYVVVNDDLERAYNEIVSIINKEKKI